MEITAIVKIPRAHNKLAFLYAVYRFFYDIKTLYDVCFKNRLKKTTNKHERRESAHYLEFHWNLISCRFIRRCCVFFYLRIMPIDFGIKNRYGKRIFGIFEIQKAKSEKKKMLIAIVGNIGELIWCFLDSCAWPDDKMYCVGRIQRDWVNEAAPNGWQRMKWMV